jgi:hypothetical protein
MAAGYLGLPELSAYDRPWRCLEFPSMWQGGKVGNAKGCMKKYPRSARVAHARVQRADPPTANFFSSSRPNSLARSNTRLFYWEYRNDQHKKEVLLIPMSGSSKPMPEFSPKPVPPHSLSNGPTDGKGPGKCLFSKEFLNDHPVANLLPNGPPEESLTCLDFVRGCPPPFRQLADQNAKNMRFSRGF